jgi:hypothetical protein
MNIAIYLVEQMMAGAVYDAIKLDNRAERLNYPDAIDADVIECDVVSAYPKELTSG